VWCYLRFSQWWFFHYVSGAAGRSARVTCGRLSYLCTRTTTQTVHCTAFHDFSYNAGMSSERPWYRLHLLTWLLLFCVGASLVVENVRTYHLPGMVISSRVYSFFWAGWPTRWIDTDSGHLHNCYGFIDLSRVGLNLLVSASLLISTAFATEHRLRREGKWHQFTIAFILALTAFVALLCANVKYELIRWHGEAAWEYVPFAFIAFGAWCAFWAAWTLLRRVATCFQPPHCDRPLPNH